jgi:hypothetical protein
MFQSTHPHGARQKVPGENRPEKSFNPRTRTGRDGNSYAEMCHELVSIHAPARGATAYVVYNYISIIYNFIFAN